LGTSVTACGDITIFKIDSTTGRLSLITNTQGTSTLGSSLTYFPVPANPIDFVLDGSYVLTLSGTSTTGDSVFPYAYTASSGQLSLTQNTSQPLSIKQATSIVVAGGYLYVLDNEAPSSNSTGAVSMIIPYTLGSAGALQATTDGQVANDPTLANPSYLMVSGSYLYVANQGNNPQNTSNAYSGITGYVITTSPAFHLAFTTPSTFGTGSGPQCIVEDPSNQYIYTANYTDSTVTGHVLNPQAGVLTDLRVASSYTLTGPPTWCLMDGRTN